jgi:predicted PurR-regulated permease PerM
MVKNAKRIEQVAGLVLIGAIVIGCWLVLRPFLSSILWAAILCLATWPLHDLLLRWLRGRHTLTAAIMTLILSLAILIPFIVVGLTFTESIQSAVGWVEAEVGAAPRQPPAWVQRIPWVGPEIRDYWIRLVEDARPALTWLTPWLHEAGAWLLRHSFDLATGVLHLAMSVLIAFFLYRDGEGLVQRLRAVIRQIGGDSASRLVDVVRVTVKSVVYGVIGTALAQGIVAAIGFAIVQAPAPVLLALFTFFLSFVPVGPPIVWIGVCIWLLSQGRIGWAIFMAVYGTFVISSVDNLIKPYIISRGSRLSFIVMFTGVLGGVAAFGFLGVFLGPTLLAVGYALAQEILGWPSVPSEPESGSSPRGKAVR